MLVQKAVGLLLLLFLLGCGTEARDGSATSGTGGTGGAGGSPSEGGAGGSDDGPGGAGGADEPGGSGGAGGTGGDRTGAIVFLDVGEEGLAVPLHGYAPVELQVNREIAGPGGILIELGADAHRSFWLGDGPSSRRGTFEHLRIDEGSDSGRLYVFNARGREALQAPVTLPLRVVGEDWEEILELRVRAVPWVTSPADDGDGSLRDVIASIRDYLEDPTIRFAPWVFQEGPVTITLESPIPIDAPLRIEGPLDDDDLPLVTLDGQGETRIFEIGQIEGDLPDPENPPMIRIHGLRLHRGHTQWDGGCIFSRLGLELERSELRECFAGRYGGGIDSPYTVIRETLFVDNEAREGGAARLTYFFSIEKSIFTENRASFQGGALYLLASSDGNPSTLDDNTFIDNSAPTGGAIASWSSLSIQKGLFESNTALEYEIPFRGDGGGAIWIGQSDGTIPEAHLHSIRFTANRAYGNGGAINARGASIHVEDCIFEGNLAEKGSESDTPSSIRGGAIASVPRSSGGEVLGALSIKGSSFHGNRAGRGGAIHAAGPFHMERSSVVDNQAEEWAGGLDLIQVPDGRLVNATIARNKALLGGGLYIHENSHLDIYYLTLVENLAEGTGDPAAGRPGPVGGLALANASIAMGRSILAKNQATGNITRDIWVEPDRGSSVAHIETKGYNIYGDAYGSSKFLDERLYNPFMRDQVGLSTETSVGIIDPLLAPLAEFDTPHGKSWAAIPQADSPAVDAIPPSSCKTDWLQEDEDQLGKARPSGEGCDIGAVEK